MTASTDPTPEGIRDLAERAQARSVVVIGGGVAGLVAAYECATVGLRVTLLEASDRLGGVVRTADVAGVRLDVGAESYATRGGSVRALIDDLGIADAVVRPSSGGAWVFGLPGGRAAPLPRGGVLGIPDNPFDPSVRRIIGWRGAWRAYLDRLRPPLTIGHDHSLGHLVRRRMGDRVVDRLVAPVTNGVYSASPDDIDVDLAAPGLNAALTRVGSLSGAVASVNASRASGAAAAPGSAVEGLDGGMSRLVDALTVRVAALAVDVRTEQPVASIEAAPAERWQVRLHAGGGVVGGRDVMEPVAPEADRADSDVTDGDVGRRNRRHNGLVADAVIVATSEAVARRLLAPVVAGLDENAGGDPPVLEVVTLVVEAPELDGHPRGSGVLTVPGTSAAKALTHSTAKWAWVAREAGDGIHVLRVSFGAQGEPPATAGLNDVKASRLALSEASALLGVPLAVAQLRGAHRERYVQAQPAATIGRAAHIAAARAAIGAVPRLAAVGAWMSGTGLAQVIPDASAEADRIRSGVLWAV